MLSNIYRQATRAVQRRVHGVVQELPLLAGPRAHIHTRRFSIDDAGHEKREGSNVQSPTRTIQLRFSVVPESMPDAIRALREVERKYGRIREYRLVRDTELSSEYRAICWAAFESPESLKRVPVRGAVLKVTLPPSTGKPEGGPSLDDLDGLLEPAKRSLSFQGISEISENSRTLAVNVRRADTDIRFRSTVKPPYRSRAMKAAIGHAFLEWGGFTPLKSVYESSPFTGPSQDPQPLDNKNMRMALNKWSQILDLPDPSFPEMLAERNHPSESPEVTSPRPSSSKERQPSRRSSSRKAKIDDEWEPLPSSKPKIQPEACQYGREELEPEKWMGGTGNESLKESLESILKGSQSRQEAHGQASAQGHSDEEGSQKGRSWGVGK